MNLLKLICKYYRQNSIVTLCYDKISISIVNSHGLVGHRTRDTAQDFKPPHIIAYYAVDYVKNAKGTNYWRNRILKVAKEFDGKYTFAISSKDDFQHELNEYGYDYTGDKPVVLARDDQNQKFIMKTEFS